MKIGIDASRYSHASATGVEWYSWHIINNLIKQADKNDKLVLYSREPILADFAKVPSATLSRNIPAENKVLHARRLWTLKRLSKEMKVDPPDVLFVPSHTLPLNLPKRTVITIHDVAFKYLRKAYSFFQYHYLDWSTNFAVKHATKIIVPSQATASDLKNFYNCPEGKLVVIPHGFSEPEALDERVFENSEILKYFNINQNMKYILFVGRLESKKNLVRLVIAFAEFLKKYPDFKLILAGKRGLGFDEILKTVNQKEIFDKVIMPGYITEHEKHALYKYCQFFVFPSLYEGFGLPILEAFYYKKPVLTSNVSSLPEVAGEAVYYVDPYDPEAILKGLYTLAAKDEYVDELINKGQEKLKEFSWEKATKETLKVLHGQ